jgi:predicted RNA binding protein YcfA (HicA-like mRNA interferase family)
MVKKRKLLRKVLSGSKNIRFDEFTALLAGFGFALERVSGSHHIYKHPSSPDLLSVQPDENHRAKPYQVRQFLKLVEEYHLTLEKETETEEENEE